MAIEKVVEDDKIEVVSADGWKVVQVRTATILKEDGVELNRSFHRHVLLPGTVAEGATTLTDTDISGEPQEVQDVCNAAWTDAVKAAYIAKCKANLGG